MIQKTMTATTTTVFSAIVPGRCHFDDSERKPKPIRTSLNRSKPYAFPKLLWGHTLVEKAAGLLVTLPCASSFQYASGFLQAGPEKPILT